MCVRCGVVRAATILSVYIKSRSISAMCSLADLPEMFHKLFHYVYSVLGTRYMNIMLTGQYLYFPAAVLNSLSWCQPMDLDAHVHIVCSSVDLCKGAGTVTSTDAHIHTVYRLHGRLDIGEMNESAGLADTAKNQHFRFSFRKSILPRLCHHCLCFLSFFRRISCEMKRQWSCLFITTLLLLLLLSTIPSLTISGTKHYRKFESNLNQQIDAVFFWQL